MENTKLSIKDGSLAFIIGFLLCQIGVISITCITYITYKLCKFDISLFSSFLSTAVGYLITTLGLYLTMIAVFIFYKKNKNIKITNRVKSNKLLLDKVLRKR